jgi:hypothetical protein
VHVIGGEHNHARSNLPIAELPCEIRQSVAKASGVLVLIGPQRLVARVAKPHPEGDTWDESLA